MVRTSFRSSSNPIEILNVGVPHRLGELGNVLANGALPHGDLFVFAHPDLVRHLVDEPEIVRHQNHPAVELLDGVCQPVDGFDGLSNGWVTSSNSRLGFRMLIIANTMRPAAGIRTRSSCSASSWSAEAVQLTRCPNSSVALKTWASR